MSRSPKEQIQELVEQFPKHYSAMIKRNTELLQWIDDNCHTTSNKLTTRIYSALYGVKTVCPTGNEREYHRNNKGLKNCGPASKCECTRKELAEKSKATKSKVSDREQQLINEKRKQTMIDKYGHAYNSQRSEVKPILQKSGLLASQVNKQRTYNKLNDCKWLYEQYVVNQRTGSDIGKEIGTYSSTVLDYCRKYGFKIRQHSNYSLVEREIATYIESLGFEVELNNRTIISPKELDIVVHDKKLAIEVDGLYWHSYHPSMHDSETLFKTKHKEKQELAGQTEYHLLQITDYEWNNKQPIVKDLINTKLGLNERIYARKCSLVELSSKAARDLATAHHLHGFSGAKKHYGLVYDNEIVCMASFGNARFGYSGIELVRLVTKHGITVVGGASKLIAHAQNSFNANIMAYCYGSISDGGVYEQCGFELHKTTEPGYVWTDGTNVFSRYQAQHNNLPKLLNEKYDPSLSESVNMFNNGYRRYWDSGNTVWVLKNDK